MVRSMFSVAFSMVFYLVRLSFKFQANPLGFFKCFDLGSFLYIEDFVVHRCLGFFLLGPAHLAAVDQAQALDGDQRRHGD